MRLNKSSIGMAVWLTMLVGPGIRAQQGVPSGMPNQPNAPNGVPSADRHRSDESPFSAEQRERLEKGRQTERQRRMIADTDRLLALATQLKAEMDKTTKDTLSIDVIKKAEEIEKLAKSVKERMKG